MSGLRRFSIATIDEIWSCDAGRTLLDRRVSHGTAEERDEMIVATDAPAPELLKRAADAALACRKSIEMVAEGRARIVASARTAATGINVSTSIAMSIEGLSVIATPDTAAHDYELLRQLASIRPEQARSYRDVPMLWRHGSAAVLLHEAVGHAAEVHHEPIAWPAWLTVRDEPDFAFDDAGNSTGSADLLAGIAPRTLRRASFADVPLQRMTRVVARQSGSHIDLPERRIEVHLVSAGRYDRLTATVTLYIAAADLVDGKKAARLQPFIISERRVDVSAALVGARGEPERYPGVVCSSEGQEIVVGSYAPLLLTVFS